MCATSKCRATYSTLDKGDVAVSALIEYACVVGSSKTFPPGGGFDGQIGVRNKRVLALERASVRCGRSASSAHQYPATLIDCCRKEPIMPSTASELVLDRGRRSGSLGRNNHYSFGWIPSDNFPEGPIRQNHPATKRNHGGGRGQPWPPPARPTTIRNPQNAMCRRRSVAVALDGWR